VLQLWQSFASVAGPMLQPRGATVSQLPMPPTRPGSRRQHLATDNIPRRQPGNCTVPAIQGSYRLAGFQQLAGRNCAVIDCQMQMSVPAAGVPMQLQANQGMISSMVAGLSDQLSGRIYFDPQAGQMVQGDFLVTLNTSNTTTGQVTVLGQSLNLNDLFKLQNFAANLTVALQ